MGMQFQRHYTLDEARELLPQVREWLDKLEELRTELRDHDQLLSERMEDGADQGGEDVNAWVKCMGEMKSTLWEFLQREIQVKDIERGLVDFPAFVEGKEVFLCWEKCEADIGFWHDLDAGYAGRRELTDE
jgi:hypothetical protein